MELVSCFIFLFKMLAVGLWILFLNLRIGNPAVKKYNFFFWNNFVYKYYATHVVSHKIIILQFCIFKDLYNHSVLHFINLL